MVFPTLRLEKQDYSITKRKITASLSNTAEYAPQAILFLSDRGEERLVRVIEVVTAWDPKEATQSAVPTP